MDKVLTVSIAAYNVEKYIKKAVESCLYDEILDDIEVLVVIDGAKDGTAAIAKEIEEKYPHSVKVIEKENGGYGSTVNTGIRNAKGRYFKLLDGDDWFDKDGLIWLIDYLKKTETDCLINRMFDVKDEVFTSVCREPEWLEYEGRTMKTEDIQSPVCTGMWQMTIRTELLQKDQYLLPEHTLYTDQLFVVNGMARIRNVYFSEIPVYCYRIGRDGQSVSRENRIKHYKETINVFLREIPLYEDNPFINENNRNFVLPRVGRFYSSVIRTLLLMPRSKETKKELVGLERKVKKESPDIYKESRKWAKKLVLLRCTNYLAYDLLAGKEKNWF